MRDDTTGRGAYHRGGCCRLRAWTMLGTETGRRAGFTALLGLEHSQLGSSALQFDVFLLELENGGGV